MPVMLAISNSMRAVICVLFLLSGFSALAYQVVWQRVLTQELGADSISIAFIVSIFLFGIGLGSFAHRFVMPMSLVRKRVLYVSLEALIGLFGCLSVVMLRYTNQMGWFGETILGQFFLNLLLLLPATALMGLATPLVLDLVRAQDEHTGRAMGLFYGINVFGAAMGAMLTGLVLIEVLGLNGVVCLAAALNLLLACAFWVALRDVRQDRNVIQTEWRDMPTMHTATFVAFAFGVASMWLQMVYFRTAFNHFQIYSFIFPFMLSGFLLSMAAGQFIFGHLADRAAKRSRDTMIALTMLIFALACLVIYRIPLEHLQPQELADYWSKFLRFAFMFSFPIAIGSGMFTLLVRLSTRRGSELGGQFGHMMAAASLGNVVGAFSAPLYLFSLIGTMGVLVCVILLYGIGCAFMLRLFAQGRLAYAAIAAAIVTAMALPQQYFDGNRMFRTETTSLSTIEDEVGIISAFEREQGALLSIQIFRSPTATVFRDGVSRGYDMQPLAQVYRGEGARMLIIGLGGANFLPYLVENPSIAEIILVELSQSVINQVRKYGTEAIRNALDSRKLQIVVSDGRRFAMQAARSGERYDIIQNGVFQPWMSGASNLYTVEMTRVIHELLNPGGVYFALDLESIAASAGQVFQYGYSSPGRDRYVYYVASDEAPEISGLCLRDLRDVVHPINYDDRPVSEYWMLGLRHQKLEAMLARQSEPYRHPCGDVKKD